MTSIIITTQKRTISPVRALSVFTALAYMVVLFVMLCGVAGAVTYDQYSGIRDINAGNCSTWSTLLSNGDNTVNTYIVINNGAVFHSDFGKCSECKSNG